MVSPTDIARAIIETFDKGAVGHFRRWLAQHPYVDKWIIAADFALRDKSRPNDCYAFTIFPYDAWPDHLKADIKAHLPRGIKKSKTLSGESETWLRDERRFHFIIPINRNRRFFLNKEGDDQRKIARESISITLSKIQKNGADARIVSALRGLSNESVGE